jgi:hypothetical protein
MWRKNRYTSAPPRCPRRRISALEAYLRRSHTDSAIRKLALRLADAGLLRGISWPLAPGHGLPDDCMRQLFVAEVRSHAEACALIGPSSGRCDQPQQRDRADRQHCGGVCRGAGQRKIVKQ